MKNGNEGTDDSATHDKCCYTRRQRYICYLPTASGSIFKTSFTVFHHTDLPSAGK